MITGGFGMTMDLERGMMRQWVMGRDGIKRWADTNEPVENLPESPTCTKSQTAAHRCIKPQCPTDCSECNHALPEDDEAAMLVCDLLDAFAVDGFDGPLEDGESQLVDRARAWLATRHREAPNVELTDK